MSDQNYINSISHRIAALLMPGEAVLYAARRHWLSYSGTLFCALLGLAGLTISLLLRPPGGPLILSLGGVSSANMGPGGALRLLNELAAAIMFLLASLTGLKTAILNWTLIMAVTNRRVIMRFGLIARDTTDIPLSKIDMVMIDQGVLDRITGCGTVVIRTISEANTSFYAISEPTALRNAVIGATENASHPASGAQAADDVTQ